MRATRLAAAVAGLAATLAAGAWWAARPATPDSFYAAPADAGAPPGTLLRAEPFARGVPAGARGWRILYTTTRSEREPAVASGLVVAAASPPAGPRPAVAWTHGTTGVVPGCAPSLLDEPFAHVPALADAVARGWVLVATDYAGLGTAGPHPYLIGEGEGRSGLDAVRAARQLEGLTLERRTVVWGHSQGGHAALWTGILAPRYAPDVPLAGVAAIAPASDVPGLVRAAQETPIGRILSAFIVRAYTETYRDVGFDATVRSGARLLARDMARRCLAGPAALVSVAEATALRGSLFAGDPGPLDARLAQNVPDAPIAAPVLVAQGLADELVLPQLQERWVAERCAAGQALELRTYEGRDHLSVVAADSPLVADLLTWTEQRLAGAPAPAGCATVRR